MAPKIIFKAPLLKKLATKLAKRFSNKKATVHVGVLAGSSREQSELSNVLLATVHEFGTSTIPARPFIGPVVRQNAELYTKRINRAWRSSDIQKELGVVGLQAVSDIQKYIRSSGDGTFTANSKKTVTKKNSGKPLIDTGQLLRSINFKVDK